MNKKIKILIIAIILILANISEVFAADATVTLNPSKTQLNPGDTFTVTINAKCEEGIDGLQGILSYDKTKIELEKIDIDTLKWGLINEEKQEGLDLGVVSNSTSKIETADILTVTFKVKNTVTESSKVKIELLDIVLGADVESEEEAEIEIGTKGIEVSIIKEQTNPNPGDNSEDDSNETPGEEPENNPNGTLEDDSNETPEENPGNEPSKNPEGNDKEDDTKAGDELPETGFFKAIGIIAIVIIFGTVCLVKYNKYKDI